MSYTKPSSRRQVSQHSDARGDGYPCAKSLSTTKIEKHETVKKTLVALLALAGVAFGADYTAETVWSLDFGSEYTNGFQWTAKDGYSYGTPWDIVAVEGGTRTNGSKRVYMAGGLFGSWDENFVFTMSVTLGDTISASNSLPVFAELSGANGSLRFGPYTTLENKVGLDGSQGSIVKGDNNLVAVSPGGTYTLEFTKIGRVVTIAVDGVVSGTATLNDGVTGNITDVMLGGDKNGDYKINEIVHSASMSILTPAPAVPEPTTTTLSLLALAGLAARRRRK